jgi:hypothetical protein
MTFKYDYYNDDEDDDEEIVADNTHTKDEREAYLENKKWLCEEMSK